MKFMKKLELPGFWTGNPSPKSKIQNPRSKMSRGQSMVEMALILPVLVVLFSAVVEGGLALNAWIRVNTAARDATRFAVDAGRPDDTASLVLTKLAGIDFGSSRTFTGSTEINVYIITGTTDASGNIPNDVTHWSVDHRWGGSPNPPRVQRTAIQQKLQSQGGTTAQNLPFKIVEVDFNYTPVLSTLIPRGTKIPMTSYSIIQQY